MNANRPVERRYFEARVERSERRDVDAEQLSALRTFLATHVARSRFHRDRAQAAGLDLENLRSIDGLRELPVMRKAAVLADIERTPPFGTLLAVEQSEIAHFVETSGTSGHGHEQYALTREDLIGLTRQEAFGFVWAGVRGGDFVATTFPMTSKAAGRWHALGVEAAGGVYLPLGGVETAKKLDYLRRFPVRTVIASPSYVRRLEMEAEREGIDLRSLDVTALMISGEPFTESWVEEREDAWGARVYEQYGSSQRALTWCCEEGAVTDGRRGVLHCPSHLALYEVIDPASGRHVEPGEFGEMVVTPFSSSGGMPLVRFASGDRVRYLGHDACACRRPFPALEAGTVYRYDDRLRVKGVNIDPETLDPLILVDDVVDYDAVAAIDDLGRETLSIQVEVREGATLASGWLTALATRLRDATGLQFIVEQAEGPLARDELSGKRKRWRDLRNSGQRETPAR